MTGVLKVWNETTQAYEPVAIGKVEQNSPAIVCQWAHSAAQSVATGASTSLNFDTALHDPDGWHAGTNDPYFIAQKDGWYRLEASVFASANTSGYREAWWYVAGARARNETVAASSGAGVMLKAVVPAVYLTAGTLCEVQVFQDSGSTLTFGHTAIHLANLATITSLDGLKGDKGEQGDPGVASLDDLTDVDLTGLAEGDFIKNVGGVWVPRAGSTASFPFGDLTDVDLATTPPTQGQAVVFDGVDTWKPGDAGGMPVGALAPFAGATAPVGWLLCDGSAVSRTTYATLYAVVGDTYGAGDGTTTFNVPNMKGRAPVGQDAGDSDFDTPGKTGGDKTHNHGSHNHGTHTHGSHTHALNGPTAANVSYANVRADVAQVSVASATHNHGLPATVGPSNFDASGNGNATPSSDNHLQPYLALPFIIKT